MGVNVVTHRLMAMLAVDDRIADVILGVRTDAYIRGFVVMDRETKEVSASYRFKYPDGRTNWYEIQPDPKVQSIAKRTPEEMVELFIEGIKKAFGIMLETVNFPEPVAVFRPPDDDGDPDKTIQWLVDQDLIDVKIRGDLVKVGNA